MLRDHQGQSNQLGPVGAGVRKDCKEEPRFELVRQRAEEGKRHSGQGEQLAFERPHGRGGLWHQMLVGLLWHGTSEGGSNFPEPSASGR